MAAEDRFKQRRAADRRCRLRLPAGLVAGRALHRLCVRSGGGDRAVAAGSELGSHTATDPGWRGQRRATLVSGGSAGPVRVERLPPPFPRVCSRGARGAADQPGPPDRGEQELTAALLLQRLRSRDQPDLDTRRGGDRVRFQSRSHSRHRGLVARGGGSRCASARAALRGDQLAGTTGLFARRQTDRLQLVPRAQLAAAVADARRRRRAVPADLRRLGRDQPAMVAGRGVHCLHFQS